MEIVQAILFTTRMIFQNGNLDLYYMLALVLAVVMIKRGDYRQHLKAFIGVIVYFIIMALTSIFFSGMQYDWKNPTVFISKIALCMILMLAVSDYFPKVRLKSFIYFVSIIYLIQTIIALIYMKAPFWRLHDTTNTLFSNRLQLLYIEPSELSMSVAFMIILIAYAIERDGFDKWYLPCGVILLGDMYLSAGLGGILSLAAAAGVGILYYGIRLIIQKRCYYMILLFVLIAIVILMFYQFSDFYVFQRVKLILNGDFFADSSAAWRITIPLIVIGPYLTCTHYMGFGLGNFNTEWTLDYILNHFGIREYFPNSFLNFAATGGILAIAAMVVGIICLGVLAFKSKKASIIALFVFIIIYQIPGGYFTNPLNWVCYGIILAASIKESAIQNN